MELAAPSFGWQMLPCSTALEPLALEEITLPPAIAYVPEEPSPDFHRRFVSVYCELYQFPFQGIEDLIFENTFGRRDRVPFFRVFSDRHCSLREVLLHLFSEESPTPAEVTAGLRILRSLYNVCDDTDSDLFCGDLVLFNGELYDWNTQKMSLRKYRQLEEGHSLCPKKRVLNKTFPNLLHGIPCRNQKASCQKSHLWGLIESRLEMQPTVLIYRLVSSLLQTFNRLNQLVDGDIILDAVSRAVSEKGLEAPRVEVADIAPVLTDWPRMRVFSEVKHDPKTIAFLHNSALFSICRPVPNRSEADVFVQESKVKSFGGRYRFVYDPEAEQQKRGGGSVALVRVNHTKQQRENGRRGCVATDHLRAYIEENHDMRLLWLHELCRLISLQPLLSQASVYVLIIMPIRNEVKCARSLLPYHSVILTHRPVLWTGKSRKKGSTCGLPGIEHVASDQEHIWLRLSGQTLKFLRHLYVIESNSFRFKRMRVDGSKVYYV